MKAYLLILMTGITSIGLTAPTAYYVNLNGDNRNTGLSEADAWRTITYAVSDRSPVVAGDFVYVKAGNYGNENVLVQKDGRERKLISIVGYKDFPGDVKELPYQYGDNVDAALMPLLDGGDRTTGLGFDINGASYIHLKNLQIANYEAGILTWSTSSTGLLLENILVMSIGDPNSSYSGKGIAIVYGEGNRIWKCIVVNSCAEGITVVSNRNIIENCKVFCDEDQTEHASTDYYIFTEGNNNTIRNCYIERVGDLEHVGHGMGLKGNSEKNVFEGCIAKNLEGGGFYVRHRGAKFNRFSHCTAIGATGFLVRDGASWNAFVSCKTIDCYSAVLFLDTGEDEGAQYAGRRNSFVNSIFRNSKYAIDFHSYDQVSIADSNQFIQCDFYKGEYLFRTNRENDNNAMKNCIVTNMDNLQTGTDVLNFDYSYSCFYDNDFPMPLGMMNISNNPMYVDASNDDFHLSESSPCIDAGKNLPLYSYDFDDVKRPQGGGFDIGSFEYEFTLSSHDLEIKKSLTVYPNPASDYISINSVETESIQIINSIGLSLGCFRCVNKQKIDITSFSNGKYQIIGFDNNGDLVSTGEFVKF